MMAEHPWLNYSNQSATRNLPLDPKLIEALSFLPELGVTMNVYSGGQPSEGPNRVGSHRHDHGQSGDVMFYKDGRMLDWNNQADLPILSDIVARAKAGGVTGIGAGDDYMGPGRIHVGFGAPAVWGANGKSANAPKWLVNAYYGAPKPTPAVAAINAATKPQQPNPPGNWWSNPMGTLTANIGGIMGAALPQTQRPGFGKSLMSAAIGSLPVRTAFVKSLMNQNIGSAPSIMSGHVPGGSQVMSVSSSGSAPVTLMSPSNEGSRAFDRDVHSGQDMNVYRANREAVGDRLTQSNIDRALSSGSTLYRR